MTNQQKDLKNETLKTYTFLVGMYQDDYFPNKCVDKGKQILIDLCFNIEQKEPKDLEELYQLSHKATDKFNDLQDDFLDNDSEIETTARECIAADFETIANNYGFENADIEELIATRDW